MSKLISLLMNLPKIKGNILYRYVPSPKINAGSEITLEQLRTKIYDGDYSRELITYDAFEKKPNEEYISLLYSGKSSQQERFFNCLEYLSKSRKKFPQKFAFIEIDICSILEKINSSYKYTAIELTLEDDAFISSPQKGCYEQAVHLGLWYHPKEYLNEEDIEIAIINLLKENFFFFIKEKEGKIYGVHSREKIQEKVISLPK
ncbi:hypothetical protein [Parasaccharibacter sp. TMW2.1890]|uniref:hypothetical protein n=1 Tax=Parasaccharibacter sp. TMW2.1890 TaxID=2039289 RepID=UPI002012C862|nr:hypothetical protein [Parasaccharibacter sp. TMW2.1890]MCL1514731.1 hypothetical protein [Parasaccharibacter sp. TMW2.1890]